VIRLPEGVVVADDRPIEKRYRSVVAGLTRRIRLLYDAAWERFGEKGLSLVRDTSRAYGEEIAERARGMVDADDIKSVGSFVIRVFNTIGGEGEVTEYGSDRIVIRVRRCPYRFDRTEMCLAHTEMEKALVENVGRNVRYFIECSIPAGDEYCDHVIEKV
jgi:hypothetical protein